ncbi:hypothetical protein OAD02_05905 [Alphaproteobacteria bacterium]|nr:hypothetical protein [Alphaproteobacteria bacterium]
MKKFLILLITLFSSASWGDTLISPIGFQNTDENRKKVISFIVKNVKKELTALGMDNPSNLRIMEENELKSFKKLLDVKDKTLLRKVMIEVCDILDMCNYEYILIMYEQEKKASNSKLEW